MPRPCLRLRLRHSLLPSVLWLLLACGPAPAADLAVDHLFPGGGARGQEVSLTVAGTFPRWPVKVWVSEPGVRIKAAAEKGKFTARIAAEAAPGLRLLRFHDGHEASPLKPFLVGTVPELLESEPNNELSQAQVIDRLPALVNGRLGRAGDVDVFRLRLRKGDLLAASVDGHGRLGSPMDAVLQVISPAGLVEDQVDDNPGLDPRLAFSAPRDGEFLVRLFAFPSTPNSTIGLAGGPSFVYRLTLTTSGFLEQAMPLAVPPAPDVRVRPLGWNVPPGMESLQLVPTGEGDHLHAWHPSLAGDLVLPRVGHESLVEAPHESSSPRQPRVLPLPACFSGVIEPGEKEDRIRLALKKGQACRVRVDAQSLGSPLDPVLRIEDPAGKTVAERDDSSGRDVELSITAPRDSNFDVVVSDLNHEGSPRSVYRLTVTPLVPDFALESAQDRVTVAHGKPASLKLKVSRRDGHALPIEISCEGLPSGLTARPARSEPKGPSAAAVTLTLEAAENAAPFSGPFRVVGRAAEVRKPVHTSAGLDGVQSDQLWLIVPARAN